ncbi:NUDIX domain-containing protein [Actinopolymorpha pittospori]
MTERFRVVPAAYIVFRRDDRGEDQILLQLRQGTGYMDGHWAVAAAGHVEADESAVAAACREAAEELGVTIKPNDLTPLTAIHRTGGNHQSIDERVDFFFECRSWTGEPRLLEPEKAADLRWCPLDALPDPVVPHERFVFDHLRGGAVPPPILTYGF